MRYLILYFLLPLLVGACCSFKEKASIDFENISALIKVKSEKAVSSGSGTLIKTNNKDKHAVLTAKHVVKPSGKEVAIKVVVNGLSFDVAEVFLHPDYDIAILTFETSNVLSYAKIDNGNPRPTEEVYAAGYPLQIGLIVTHGIANYSVQTSPGAGYAPMFFCSAPIYSGNSGGGVYSKESGKLIGVSIMVGAEASMYNKIIVPHTHFFIPTAAIHNWIGGVIDER